MSTVLSHIEICPGRAPEFQKGMYGRPDNVLYAGRHRPSEPKIGAGSFEPGQPEFTLKPLNLILS